MRQELLLDRYRTDVEQPSMSLKRLITEVACLVALGLDGGPIIEGLMLAVLLILLTQAEKPQVTQRMWQAAGQLWMTILTFAR